MLDFGKFYSDMGKMWRFQNISPYFGSPKSAIYRSRHPHGKNNCKKTELR